MNKKEQLEFEKFFNNMKKLSGGIDGMIEKGLIKVFNDFNEIDEFYETKPTKNNTLVIEGDVGRRISNKIHRNSKCPCGSGLKYKKCCL